MHLRDLRMIAKIFGHYPGVAVSTFHAQGECLERPTNHPAGMWIELCADGTPQLLDGLRQALTAERGAGDQIGMPTDILGQRIHGYVGSEQQRTLENRPQQRVVADHDWAVLLPRCDVFGDPGDELDVDHRIEWV